MRTRFLTQLASAALIVVGACGGDTGPSDASLRCSADEQCSDGVYCNGEEVCSPEAAGASPLGCLAGVAPCVAGQVCDEVGASCETLCELTDDADGDGVAALECGGNDCDDADPNRFPGNIEVCDALGVDEDCDPDTVGARDLDGDGFDDAACCNGDNCGTDCADGLASVNPGAAEVCDLIDQDCDGDVDEGVQTSGFEDRDGDRYGDPDRPRMACAFDGDVTPSMDECDDADGTRNGQALEICDGIDNDCDDAVDEDRFSVSWYADTDGDGFGDPSGEVRSSCEPIAGFSTLPFDCDDDDASRSPITPELCNGRDDDCDGRADFQLDVGDTEDDDGDGVADARCPGDLGTDCDDRDPLVAPGTAELCDGVDNDCDGTVDEGATEQLWYVDEDRDGFGDEAAERRASCERVPGRVLRGGDCDDGDGERRPGASERCNGIDDDCDGTVDEDAGFVATYADDDGDGFGTGMPVAACAVAGLRTTTPGDCDDRDPASRPGAAELCDDVDNDCDGTTDEASVAVPWYPDGDGDGYGDGAGDPTVSCEPVPGQATVGTDCDDGSATRFPGAPELCDSLDNDCDGAVDEDATATTLQYPDTDGDGFGDGAGTASCEPLPGHTLRGGDCDDADPAVGPAALERCNGDDDDCDGSVDEAPAGYVSCGVDATNATPLCGPGGVCGYGACLSGFGDCDGVVVNGCESDLSSGSQTCGACDSSCGPGGVCTSGSCADVPVTSVAVAVGIGCAVRGGRVHCWGDEDATGTPGGRGDGELAAGILYAPRDDQPVVGLTDATKVVGGGSHFCALRATGAVVCWGDNTANRIGDGSGLGPRHTPVPITGGHLFEDIEAGLGQTCGRTAAGRVYCWGDAGSIEGHDGVAEIVRADGTATDAVALAVGRDHVCIADSTGRVFCRGFQAVELGQPSGLTFPDFVGPVRLIDDQPLDQVTSLAAAGRTTCALRTDGRVFCWGRNDLGQLGDGTTADRSFAAPVQGLTDGAGLFIGTGLGCAWRTGGSVVCWGRNDDLQLGDSSFTAALSTVPRPLPGLNAVVGGSSFIRSFSFRTSLCAAEGGGVVCWGFGARGATGDGSTANDLRAPPVRVVGFP